VRHVTAAMEADLGEMPSAEAVDRVRRAFSRRPAVATVGWLERAERFVARLVFDQRQQPMLAGFRGGGEAAQLAYECDQARVDLRLAPPRSPGAGAWRLNGQIALRGDARGGGSVALVPGGEAASVAEATLDERGRFRLSPAAGTYDLMIELEDGVVVVPDLRLGD